MLKIKKNIKEYQPKIQENQDAISKALGVTITIEPNYDSFINTMEERLKASLGWYVAGYTDALKVAFETLAQEEIVKQHLLKTISAKKIIIKTNPGNQDKFEYVFENGALVLNCKPDMVQFSLDYSDKLILAQLDKITQVFTYQNLALHKAKYDTAVQQIQKATGKNDIPLEIDEKVFMELAPKEDLKYLGYYLYEGLAKEIGNDIENLCKDEDAKEAFVATVKKIQVVPEKSNQYKHEFELKDGVFRVKVKPDMLKFFYDQNSGSKFLMNNL